MGRSRRSSWSVGRGSSRWRRALGWWTRRRAWRRACSTKWRRRWPRGRTWPDSRPMAVSRRQLSGLRVRSGARPSGTLGTRTGAGAARPERSRRQPVSLRSMRAPGNPGRFRRPCRQSTRLGPCGVGGEGSRRQPVCHSQPAWEGCRRQPVCHSTQGVPVTRGHTRVCPRFQWPAPLTPIGSR